MANNQTVPAPSDLMLYSKIAAEAQRNLAEMYASAAPDISKIFGEMSRSLPGVQKSIASMMKTFDSVDLLRTQQNVLRATSLTPFHQLFDSLSQVNWSALLSLPKRQDVVVSPKPLTIGVKVFDPVAVTEAVEVEVEVVDAVVTPHTVLPCPPRNAIYIDDRIAYCSIGRTYFYFLTDNGWHREYIMPLAIRMLEYGRRVFGDPAQRTAPLNVWAKRFSKSQNERHARSSISNCFRKVAQLCIKHDCKQIFIKTAGEWGVNPELSRVCPPPNRLLGTRWS